MCQAQAIIYYCPISFQVEPSCEHSFAKYGDIKFERCTDYSGEYFSQCPDIRLGRLSTGPTVRPVQPALGVRYVA